MWGLWGDLPFPTVATAFGESRMAEILECLAAHAGELDRNDYRRLVRGRAEANASLGPERVFGFGTVAVGGDPRWEDAGGDGRQSHGVAGGNTYVELLSEVGLAGGRWRLGTPRWLAGADPLPELSGRDIDDWLHSESLTDRYGPPGE